jgi:magnesium-transporting ATPase (P-type)
VHTKRTLARVVEANSPRATVTRDARRQEVPVDEIVIGDIVHLGAGVVVPADSRVLGSDALAAVQDLRPAGVDEAMITGDHASTAEAIAAELGFLNGGRVTTGPDLDELDDRELADALVSAAVFARVTPAHKVRLVHPVFSVPCNRMANADKPGSMECSKPTSISSGADRLSLTGSDSASFARR